MFRTTIAAQGTVAARYPVRSGSRHGAAAVLSVLAWLFAMPYQVLSTLRMWQARSAFRGKLMSLDDHQLTDIGLTTGEASREIQKPFWVE